MTWQAYILVIFVITSASGGLASAIMNSLMIDALNRGRPTEDQIPAVIASSKDIRWYLRNAPSPYWRVLRLFHQQFPESRLYFWSLLTLVLMLVMFGAAGVALVLWR